jgi:sirohydrochlorin cobaltochelatase
VVLLAHGTKGLPRPLQEVRAWTQEALPETLVEDAYLIQSPTLEEALAEMVARGVGEAVVVPLLVAAGHHLDEELPRRLEDLRARFPGLLLSQGPHLGGDAAIVDLILHRLGQARRAVEAKAVREA